MDAETALNILKQAYRLSPFRVNNVIQFVKYPSDKPTSYPTIHGAFIFPLEGEAEIRFDDKCFIAKPGTMVHGCPGCRPINFLIDYRINMAAKLLREQGCTVTEAAETVGYNDPLHFSRLFKKRTGYAPSQIQRKDG